MRLELRLTVGREHQFVKERGIEKPWVRLTRSGAITWLVGIAGNRDLLPDLTTHVKVLGDLIKNGEAD